MSYENGSCKENPNAIVRSINATAPYNFVQFPSSVLVSPLHHMLEDQQRPPVEVYKEYIKSIEKYSGSIVLNMRSITPLFIRNDEGTTIAPIDEHHPIIPGSSIRGMIKSLYKIVTCGAVRSGEDYTDKHMYYRCIMAPKSAPSWMNPLNEKYKSRMVHSEIRNGCPVDVTNTKAGFLMQIGTEYWIAPYLRDNQYINDNRIFIMEYQDKYDVTIGIRNASEVVWDGTIAYIITGSNKKLYTRAQYNAMSVVEQQKAGKQQIRCLKLQFIDMARDHWKRVPSSVIEEYREDVNRKGVNLLDTDLEGCLNRDRIAELKPELLEHDVKTLVPCFFIEEEGAITGFGHGQSFRIPYNHSIGDLIPSRIKGNEVDFSDAVFGKKENWGSRVFFDDAIVKQEAHILPSKTVILSEPKPTSYQLYLKQEINKPINHWDSPNAKLRGYKMYWHQKPGTWDSVASVAPSNSSTTIKPIDAGTEFIGKIRFKNLSREELGALMTIFDLNNASRRIAYRLGQGKSLGLGSVTITPKLFIDSNDEYATLFDEDGGWKSGAVETDPANFREAFKEYVVENNVEPVWSKIIQELQLALNFRNATGIPDWQDRIKAMKNDMVNDDVDPYFKERMPIKTITEVTRR